MDFLFIYFLLILLAGLTYSLYRLYQVKTVTGLSVAAVQLSVIAFLLFSYDGRLYREPFITLTAFVLGVVLPGTNLVGDFLKLRAKVKKGFGLSMTRFIYQNERNEQLRDTEKIKAAEQVLRPMAGYASLEDIMGEIRVERADTSQNVQRQLENAMNLFNENDIDGALLAYQTVEKIFNRSASLYYNMGNLAYSNGEYEAAVKLFRRAAECTAVKEFSQDDVSEKMGRIYYNMGNTLFMVQKYPRAVEAYKTSISALPYNSDAYYNMSFCHATDYMETGDNESAVEAFRVLVEDMPQNLHAWFNYGKCLLKMGNASQAVECFTRVTEEDVMNNEAWFMLARALDERGDRIAEAAQAYRTSIQLKPSNIEAYNNLAIMLSAVGSYKEAIRVLKTALRLKPDDLDLIRNLGVMFYESGVYPDALAEFTRYAKSAPDDESVLYMISVCLMNLGRQQDSLNILEKAVTSAPDIKEKAIKERVFQKYIHKQEYQKIFA